MEWRIGSNSRFEPTPRQGMNGPGNQGAMNLMKQVAVRSATLSRVVAAHHPATRGSSARRSAGPL